jgi:hypothetical protein
VRQLLKLGRNADNDKGVEMAHAQMSLSPSIYRRAGNIEPLFFVSDSISVNRIPVKGLKAATFIPKPNLNVAPLLVLD